MANLDLIKSLNERYGKKSAILTATKTFSINERLDPDKIEKALTDSISSMGPLYARYFDLGLPADIAMLFIDVCSFSTRNEHLNGEEIGDFFDKYYDIVIPIIYKHGGEVDKVIGDGIICIFGKPFLDVDLEKAIIAGNNCAKEIILATMATQFSSKIAFHCGEINYFKNKTGLYKEFTIIGKPLTELFRLETISTDESITYYGDTKIRNFYSSIINAFVPSTNSSEFLWIHRDFKLPLLKGVNYTDYYTIKYE